MRSLLTISFLLIFSVFVSCRKTDLVKTGFFDSLVNSQVSALALANAKVSKVARIDTTASQNNFTPDTTIWRTELDAFRQLDVFEKPIYKDAYVIEDKIDDPKSNLLIKSYQSRREVPVMTLRFFYNKTIGNLKKIEGIYQEKNSLYSSRRLLKMEFDERKGLLLISSYSIEGSQKMILSDSVHFLIKSSVLF